MLSNIQSLSYPSHQSYLGCSPWMRVRENLTMDKMDPRSMDIVAENIRQLRQLFPEAFTEKKVDFKVLKEILGEYVDDSTERYNFTWSDKSKARVLAQTPSIGTLRPCKKESLDWDTTQNIFIEGDNLEVLKLLQKSYYKKVKMIYIDPPYNTGSDFVYKDDFKDNIKNYKKITGQVDGDGRNYSINPETSGRYHTDWLNMMYPRLKLAWNLLRDDGVIFISIDDNEQANLKRMCDEIFGEENFVANVIWEKKYAPQNDAKWLSDSHDYVLVYGRSKDNWRPIPLPRSEKQRKLYRNRDNDPRGDWKPDNLLRKEEQRTGLYTIVTPSGRECRPRSGTSWRVPEYKLKELVADNRIWFGEEGNNIPSLKRFISEIKDGVTPMTIWKYEDVGHNQEATKQLRLLFDNKAYFDTPKPLRLLQRMLRISTVANDIVLDFFAGTATTAHACLQLNTEDGGKRKFIMVQLPESYNEESEASKAGYENIADIGKERIRRATAKIKEDNPGYDGDLGFRVFKLDSTNINPWETDPNLDGKQMEAFVENIKTGRDEQDVIYEILLKYGLDLTLPITEHTIAGQQVFSIGEGSLIVCLSDSISSGVVKGIVELKDQLNPEFTRVVFKDAGFEDDVAKTNAAQTLKQADVADVKSL